MKNAEDFVKYLLSSSSQKIIMEKNFMLPVIEGVKKNTPFDFPKNIRLIDAVDGHDIACKVDGIGSINLKSEFVKKA